MRGKLATALVSLVFAMSSVSARAHEFWIDPLKRMDEPGEIKTDLRVGQFFIGDVYPYISSKFNFLKLTARGESTDIAGNEGDLPAIDIPKAKPGLNIISFYGKPNRVVFDDLELFLTYLTTEGLRWVWEEHKKRGLPRTGFTEVFSRTVKSLVQAGPITPEDKDQIIGMPFEIVAEANPYKYPQIKELPVTLYWQGKPLADWQLSIFRKTREQQELAARTDVHTDADGHATIDLSGGGRFLINAVHMRVPAPELDAAWESHWASLTFALKLTDETPTE